MSMSRAGMRRIDPKRAGDLALLKALLERAEELREEEAMAFTDMLSWLDRKEHAALSEKQRSWGEQAASRLEIGDPSERNRDVPRGREVEPADVLKHLPKVPPGRRRSA